MAWGRHRFPPLGIAGGRDGSPNIVEVVPADGSPPVRFGKAVDFPLRRWDLIRLITGTGGGCGDPRERESDPRSRGPAKGAIAEREAREVYGSAPVVQ